MPLPDSNLSTLQQIIIKVRKLTRSLSEQLLSTQDIENYINTFVLYDFPEQLRLANLRTTLTFYAAPNIDTYDSTKITNPADPLYNFLNVYTTVHPPVYIAGYSSMFSQSRESFFAIYPMVSSIASIGSQGDDVTTNFTGTLANTPILQNNVQFTSVDQSNNPCTLIDLPINASTGTLINPATGLGNVNNTINYITGAFNITFDTAPGSGQAINSQTVPYVASQPQALLFYDGVFTLRPVPDQPYAINLEVFKRPSALLSTNQTPELSEWWQYIAYGAAKKIFEDRMDLDSVQMILPEFSNQENLINRRTIVQQTSERTATIYTEQTTIGYGPGWWFGGGSF